MEIEITVNGRKRNFVVEPNTLLLNLVREDLHLTGTKYGCGYPQDTLGIIPAQFRDSCDI